MKKKNCRLCGKKMNIKIRQAHKKVCSICSGRIKQARVNANYHQQVKNNNSRAKYWIERKQYFENILEGGDQHG